MLVTVSYVHPSLIFVTKDRPYKSVQGTGPLRALLAWKGLISDSDKQLVIHYGSQKSLTVRIQWQW